MSQPVFKSYQEEKDWKDEQQVIKAQEAKALAAEKEEERKRRIPRNTVIIQLKEDAGHVNLTQLKDLESLVYNRREILAKSLLELELSAEFISPKDIDALKGKVKHNYQSIKDALKWIDLYKENIKMFSSVPELSKSIFGDAAAELYECTKNVELDPAEIAQSMFRKMKPAQASLTHITTRG